MTGTLRYTLLILLICPGVAWAQKGRCDFSNVPGVVWWGSEKQMPVARFVAYLAPVLWFSPDEPSLDRTSGLDIRIPQAFPGQPVPDRPVLYYQVDRVRTRSGGKGQAVVRSPEGPALSVITLNNISVAVISFFAYYPTEEGLGAHPHDIEPVEFRAAVVPHTFPGLTEWIPGGAKCTNPTNVIVVTRVTGKAHGLVWFWNVVHVDGDTRFPMHLLIEEGKHAIATDKNGDGVFTKSYDVNVRVNDAWGVRDIIRSGMLFSGGYESWMAKVRHPEHRIIPPLPDDSPLIPELKRRGTAQNVVYELRPYPPAGSAGDDHQLAHLMDDKAVANWPVETAVKDVAKALDEGAVLKSLSIAARADGDFGVSWSFPFFIVKHLEDPMTGGYILQRMYATGGNHHTFGWTALYTPSASRWLDTYLAAGAERAYYLDATGANVPSWDFVFETGLKLRVNINETPLKKLSFFTDYWGIRLGLRNRGFFDVEHLTYVLEVGAGSF
jgi:hypothetical protein